MPDYYVFILFAMGAAFTLGAVIVGGYLVWKTKRDPGESLFQMKEAPGEAFNVVDTLSEEESAETKPIKTPAAIAAAALKFRQQMEDEEVPVPKVAENLGEGEKSNE